MSDINMSREEKMSFIYRYTHADYKCVSHALGGRSILRMQNGATCLVPLNSLSDEELDGLIERRVSVSHEPALD